MSKKTANTSTTNKESNIRIALYLPLLNELYHLRFNILCTTSSISIAVPAISCAKVLHKCIPMQNTNNRNKAMSTRFLIFSLCISFSRSFLHILHHACLLSCLYAINPCLYFTYRVLNLLASKLQTIYQSGLWCCFLNIGQRIAKTTALICGKRC